jgi:hypothetical protein
MERRIIENGGRPKVGGLKSSSHSHIIRMKYLGHDILVWSDTPTS